MEQKPENAKPENERPPARQRVVIINSCEGCPFINYDDSFDKRKWGKNWCEKLDRELLSIAEIPDDCPLPVA